MAVKTAMILAAGQGLRMRPLTEDRAKPTLPVLGKPLLGRILCELERAGVRQFAVNAFHAADSLAAVLDEHASKDSDVQLFREKELMGTAGGLLAPMDALAAHDLFMLHNGDTLVTPPIEEMVEAARAPKCLGAILVRPGRTGHYRVLRVENGLLLGREQPEDLESDPDGRNAANYLGVAVLKRELLQQIPAGGPSELFDLVLDLLASGWSLATVPYRDLWLEFTSPETYRLNLCRLLAREKDGWVDLPGGRCRVERRFGSVVYWGPGSSYHAGARLEGPCIVESRARLGFGCFVQRSLIMEHAELSAGAFVAEAIVAPHTRLGRPDIFRRGVIAMGAESHERPGKARYVPFASAR